MDFPSDKTGLRTRFRAARREISEDRRRRDDRSINAAVETFAVQLGARRISGYLAFDGEPDISAALTRLKADGVEVYLPVIVSRSGYSELLFRRWRPSAGPAETAEMQENAFGIKEPGAGDHCPVDQLDIMFVPLVAWDEGGGRLGMGGGYYDRAMEPVAADRRPLRIGVAYDLQRAESIPMSPRDVHLHGVVTESGVFTRGA